MIEKSDLENIPNELMIIGSLYKNPELYISYGSAIKSKYDFAGDGARFFYDCFEVIYKTISEKINETKINSFMIQDDERLKEYKRYGGYKSINDWMELCDVNDFENYFAILKKYSLVREFYRNGYNVEKLINHKKFDIWTASDIFKMLRSKVDKIHTVILSNQESIILNENAERDIQSYVLKPQSGLPYPWQVVDEMFKGMRMKKAVLNGFLSNEGKTRNLIMLMSYIALVKKKPVLIMSNEMDEEDLKSCLITTVTNNDCFRKLHGVKLRKPEGEIVLGKYRDFKGDFIERKKDSNGIYIEEEKNYIERLKRDSDEYNQMLEIGKWIDGQKEKLIFFKNVGTDYSDQTLEFEIRKHKLLYGINYFAYDTMKGFRTDDWMTVKQSFTKLKELMNELETWGWFVFQLADQAVHMDIFDLTSNEIANAKQIKHPVDYMLLGKRIYPNEYYKYKYIPLDQWGEPRPIPLDPDKQFFSFRIEKNRNGSKAYYPVFEYDLDYNIWDNIGVLVRA